MSQAPDGFSPPRAAGPSASSRNTSSHPLWWVVAAVAVVVIIALIVWLTLMVGEPSDEPTPPVPSASGDSSEPATDDWGAFPPLNLDSLKDLSDPAFPKTVGAHAFVKEMRDPQSVIADYDDPETIGVISAAITFSTTSYAINVDNMADPAYLGRAVCGSTTASGGKSIVCVMAGSNETLRVGTLSEDSTVDELASFTEELYDAF
ncbi:MAG: hypothetical protein Q4P15_02540 [Propionibacteriaceae bacterium]|nr:hypothetical protein [Propionibacteriaceae bacterium]